jgi:hypothetical protein
MREYVVRFFCDGNTLEQRVKALDDHSASSQICRKYPGAVIISVLHLGSASRSRQSLDDPESEEPKPATQ